MCDIIGFIMVLEWGKLVVTLRKHIFILCYSFRNKTIEVQVV